MSLMERLASAERDRGELGTAANPDNALGEALRRRETAPNSPLAELKTTVHQALLANLGPKLYDADLPADEVEQMVRAALQQEVAVTKTELSRIDRTRI